MTASCIEAAHVILVCAYVLLGAFTWISLEPDGDIITPLERLLWSLLWPLPWSLETFWGLLARVRQLAGIIDRAIGRALGALKRLRRKDPNRPTVF